MSKDAETWVWNDSKTSGNDRLVLLYLADQGNDDGTNSFPSIERIAEKCRVDKDTVRRVLTRLEAAGEILIERPARQGRGWFNRYTLVLGRPIDEVVALVEKGRDLRPFANREVKDPKRGQKGGMTPPKGGERVAQLGVIPIDPVLSTDRQTQTNPLVVLANDDGLVDDPIGGSVDERGSVRVVFDAWLACTGRTTRTVLDSKRRGKIEHALRDYPLEDVLDAVRGWEHSPHHRGENDEGKVWNEIELLLRNSAKIEYFRDLARGPRIEKKGTKPGQAPGNDKVRGFEAMTDEEIRAEGL